MRRKEFAVAAVIAGMLAAGCGGDDEPATTTPANGPKAQEKTDAASTATSPTSTSAPTTTPTAPASAGEGSGGAPDSGISTRPGGPSGGY